MARITGTRGNTNYVQNGVIINPTTASVGDNVKLVYDGILAKSGATHVYAHVGYGSKWTNAKDIPMLKTSTGFEATLPVTASDTVYVAFKDCANNWDNNSGLNYSIDVVQ